MLLAGRVATSGDEWRGRMACESACCLAVADFLCLCRCRCSPRRLSSACLAAPSLLSLCVVPSSAVRRLLLSSSDPIIHSLSAVTAARPPPAARSAPLSRLPACRSLGMTDASADYPSPFARYKLVRVEGYAERDPTDEEREAFNAQYPAAAFSRQADQPGGKVATPWVKAGRSGQRQTGGRAAREE